MHIVHSSELGKCINADSQSADMVPGEMCPVCLEDLSSQQFMTLPCSHKIHCECKYVVEKRQGSVCPVCRFKYGEQNPTNSYIDEIYRAQVVNLKEKSMYLCTACRAVFTDCPNQLCRCPKCRKYTASQLDSVVYGTVDLQGRQGTTVPQLCDTILASV